MKKIFLIVIIITAGSVLFSQENGFLQNIYKYIENTSVYELNQEEGHQIIVPYSNSKDALAALK